MLAGFEQPTAGEIFINDQAVAEVPPYRRRVNTVFQHYALFPHMDVAHNVGYGLRQQRPAPSRAEQERLVHQALELVRLQGYGQRRSWELSGGQQQRVALARALINRPTVLLLDEPLGALDLKLRREMQVELKQLQEQVGVTFIFVTHDQNEAFSMADRVAVMRDGVILQDGPPAAIYDRPVDSWVASFIGQMNFFPGVVEEPGSTATVSVANGATLGAFTPDQAFGRGENVLVAVRPERISLTRGALNGTPPEPGTVRFAGRLARSVFLGDQVEFTVMTTELGHVIVRVPNSSGAGDRPPEGGEEVVIGWRNDVARIVVDRR
jgi:spermidine/putrescine transport system ATP-binding protein